MDNNLNYINYVLSEDYNEDFRDYLIREMLKLSVELFERDEYDLYPEFVSGVIKYIRDGDKSIIQNNYNYEKYLNELIWGVVDNITKRTLDGKKKFSEVNFCDVAELLKSIKIVEEIFGEHDSIKVVIGSLFLDSIHDDPSSKSLEQAMNFSKNIIELFTWVLGKSSKLVYSGTEEVD